MELSERIQALAEFLAKAAGAERVEVEDARPLFGGAIQENWQLDLRVSDGPNKGRHQVVLRADAPSRLPVSLDRFQEFAVMRAAWEAGVAVPEPLWLCADTTVLGRPFYIMRKVEGVALGNRVVKDTTLGGDREALVERVGAEMARIHKVEPPREDLDFLELPEAAPAEAVIARLRAYIDALGEPRPALEWGLRWCERHVPGGHEVTLVHQDFRTGNFMVDRNGLVAVLDWEFAAWGDPMSDLGWFCARCWRFGRDELEAGGIGSREALYRGYERESARSVEDAAVRYWEVVAHIRWAVIALQQGARHVSGAEPSLELALVGRRAAELEFDILDMTPPQTWMPI